MNLAALFGLALAASVSPVAITFLINILGGDQPIRRGLIYTAGVFSAFSLFGLLVLYGVHGLNLAGLDDGIKDSATVQIGAGVALVLLGIRRLRRHHPKDPPPVGKPKDTKAARSPVAYFVLGFSAALTNVTSLAPIAVAMPLLKHSTLPVDETVTLGLLFQLVVIWPMFALVALRAVLGARVAPVFEAVNRGMHRAANPVMLLLTLGLGSYLLIHALVTLA